MIYILVIILKSPFLVARYILQNRALLMIVILGVVVAVVLGKLSGSQQAEAVPTYALTAPDTPQVVRTPSRIYYLNAYTDSGEYYYLTDFYEYDSGEWVHRNMPLPLHKNRAQIINR